MVAEVIPVAGAGNETGVSAQYGAAQTSTIIGPTVGAGERLRVTYLQLDWDGTQEGTIIVYFGTGAFARGTSRTLFDGGGHPTANSRGGFVAAKPDGWDGAAGEELRITSGAIDPLSVTIWYEVLAA